MEYKNNILFQAVEEFVQLHAGKRIILYGCGSAGGFILGAFKSYEVEIAYLVDGDKLKQGQEFLGVMVKSPYDLLKEPDDDYIVVLTLSASNEACEMLKSLGISEEHICVLGSGIECQKNTDLFDCFLGYSRMDDIEGFKFFGDANAKMKILTLGGSTTDYSVSGINSWPYYLQKEIDKNNISCQVINGGIGGYYSGQELLKLLRDGIYLKPDIVISYSGINDAYKKHRTEGHPLIASYLKRSLDNVLPKKNKLSYGFEKELDIAEEWIMNTRMMRAICSELDIQFHSFLQPYANIGNYKLSEREEAFLNNYNSYFGVVEETKRFFYEKVWEKLPEYPYMHDLTDIFSGMTGIYYDICHVSEEGNEIIAKEIYKRIQDKLSD